VSQGVHAACIVALASRIGPPFWKAVPMATLVGGGLGYVFLVAMAATSYDGSAKWIGRRAWNALHTAGMYVLFAIFLFSYVRRVGSPLGAAAVTALLGALLLRAAARWKAPNSRTALR